MRSPFLPASPFLRATIAAALLLCAAMRLAAADSKPAAADSKPAAKDSKSEDTTGYTGPKRAGGGPVNPEIHFPLPPPRVLTPEEEIKTFKLPPGFHAEVVACEPMIQTPIAISWDDQGRMYVCEMRGYMHDVDGTGEDQPTCRISRLESTKGDGIYDKATVFVDNLLLPRTVMALGDGAVVDVPPNLIWYHDKSGTGVADTQDLISAHYATAGGQPEHMANSATWMMDNWISSAGYGFDFSPPAGRDFSPAPDGAVWPMGEYAGRLGTPVYQLEQRPAAGALRAAQLLSPQPKPGEPIGPLGAGDERPDDLAERAHAGGESRLHGRHHEGWQAREGRFAADGRHA